MTETIPASRNEGWGFFATLRGHADQGEAWALAMQAVGRATGFSQERWGTSSTADTDGTSPTRWRTGCTRGWNWRRRSTRR